jgi:hypothetical protein
LAFFLHHEVNYWWSIFHPKSYMSQKTWINLVLFEQKPEADGLTAFLNKQGFEARSYHDWLLQSFLFLCPPRATWRVQVRKANYKPALNFITSHASATPAMQPAIRCPSCDSVNVQYPQMTRKFFTPTLLLHLGILFRIIEHEAYCEHCHFIWHLFSTRPVADPKAAAVP